MRGVRGRARPQGSIVRSLTFHFCKRLFPRLEPVIICTAPMKTGKSTLNPYAESYVPISKRGAPDGNKEARSPKEFKSGREAPGVTAVRNQQQTSQIADQYKLKDYSAYGSPSHSPVGAMGKQILSEESYMDLAYLQMTFPGMSDESLSEVYLANKCDLDAAVDMLNQLEMLAETEQRTPKYLQQIIAPTGGIMTSSGEQPAIVQEKINQLGLQSFNKSGIKRKTSMSSLASVWEEKAIAAGVAKDNTIGYFSQGSVGLISTSRSIHALRKKFNFAPALTQAKQKDNSFQEIRNLDTQTSKLLCCHFDSKGELFATGGYDGEVSLIDLQQDSSLSGGTAVISTYPR